MKATASQLLDLELALDAVEHCDHCRRTLLIGEQVHVYDEERLVCEICRPLEPGPPQGIRLVHGPAAVNIRIIDQRRR
jgi:hypothetical protein